MSATICPPDACIQHHSTAGSAQKHWAKFILTTMPVPSPSTCASDSDLGRNADTLATSCNRFSNLKIRSKKKNLHCNFRNLLQVIASLHIAWRSLRLPSSRFWRLSLTRKTPRSFLDSKICCNTNRAAISTSAFHLFDFSIFVHGFLYVCAIMFGTWSALRHFGIAFQVDPWRLVEQLVKTLISSPVAESLGSRAVPRPKVPIKVPKGSLVVARCRCRGLGCCLPRVPRISGDIKDLKLSNEVSDDQIPRRNSYELAKAESSLRRKPFYGEPSGKMPEDGQGGQEKNASKSPWKSWKLEAAFAGIILSNSILLGIQTEWASRNLHAEEPMVFRVLQIVYAMLFVGEIAWRISHSGCKAYLCSADWGWHTLDLFVTFSAVLDVVMTLGGGASLTGRSNSGFRLLRVMKIARLVRAIRVVKVPEFHHVSRFSSRLSSSFI